METNSGTAPMPLDRAPAAAPHGTPARPKLLTGPILLLLACGLLGWTAEGIVQPAIPLLILDRGGDAVLVGLVAAAFALPTLILRPLVGHRIDHVGHGPIHRLGGVILAIAPLGFTFVPLLLVPLARLVNGVGWSMYGTANNVVLARLAPASRRAEASAYFNVAYASGFLIGPPLGLFLYGGGSTSVLPFLAASLVSSGAFIAAAVLARLTREQGAEGSHRATSALPPPEHASEAAPASAARGVASSAPAARPHEAAPPLPSANRIFRNLSRLFEPSAVPAMLGTALFMASQSLFLPFAVVWAREHDVPVERLAIYFPAYALLLITGQLLTGRVSDRLGRIPAIRLGVGLAVTGLLVAVIPGELLTFAAGGGLVAIGTSFATPSFAAAAMDRAPAGRLGVSMATFSMGYQIASGFGGAMWGVIIASAGYPWPFIVAAVLQVGSLLLALRYLEPKPVAAAPADQAATAG